MCTSLVTQTCGTSPGGVAGCQQWSPQTPAGKAILGIVNTLQFSDGSGQNGQTVIATYSGGAGNRVLRYNFICNLEIVVGSPVFYIENPSFVYNFNWETSYACGSCNGNDCQSCTSSSSCEWCLDSSACISVDTQNCNNFITNATFCPASPCLQYSTCTTCLSGGNNAMCDWCLTDNSCIPISQAHQCGNVYNNPVFCSSEKNQIVISD